MEVYGFQQFFRLPVQVCSNPDSAALHVGKEIIGGLGHHSSEEGRIPADCRSFTHLHDRPLVLHEFAG